MFFFNYYIQQIMKYDSINVLSLYDIKQIPKFQTIVLNFGYQKSNFKRFISGLLALKFITSKNSKIAVSKHLNIFLKIKKGTPVGCKIVLKKKVMHQFYLKLATSVLSKLKNTKFHPNYKSASITIKNPLIFMELEDRYEIFKDIPKLDITITTTCKSNNEFFFLLKSIKIFL